MSETQPADDLLTLSEAAAISGLTVDTLRSYIHGKRGPTPKPGVLRGVKRGPIWMIHRADLDAYLASRTKRPDRAKLFITPPELPIQTWSGLREALAAAETADDVRRAYDDLVTYYRRPRTLTTTYLGAPQSPEEAAWRAINAYLPQLSEAQQALIVPVLDQTVRERPTLSVE